MILMFLGALLTLLGSVSPLFSSFPECNQSLDRNCNKLRLSQKKIKDLLELKKMDLRNMYD